MSLGNIIGSLVSRHTARETTDATLDQREKERRQSLAMAELGRRLEVHQQAFSLWYRISDMAFGGQDELIKLLEDAHEWWVNNCLYLSSEARYAFVDSINVAKNRPMLLAEFRRGIDMERDVRNIEELIDENAKRIMKCGRVIEKCADMPGFAQQDMFPKNDSTTGEKTTGD